MMMMMMMRGRWWRECWGGRPIPRPGSTLCASLRSRNAYGHLRRAILCGNLHEKCWTPIPGTSFRASLRSRNAHGHFTRAILCGNLKEKCGTPFRGKHFVRACAVETHIDIWEGPFCVEIHGKNAVRQSRGKHFARACAVEHFQRAILRGNLQETCRTRLRTPRLNTGP